MPFPFLLQNGTFVPWKENIPHFSNNHHGECSSAKSRELVCVDWRGDKTFFPQITYTSLENVGSKK